VSWLRLAGVAMILVVACRKAGGPSIRIRGGIPYPDFKKVVVIGTTNDGGTFTAECSGIAIAKDRVLTAGHCVGCDRIDLVVTDAASANGNPLPIKVTKVTKVIRHYGYREISPPESTGKTFAHDLAILELASATLTPSSLGDAVSVTSSRRSRRVGYGWSHGTRGKRLYGDGWSEPVSPVDPSIIKFAFDDGIEVCSIDSGGGVFLLDAANKPQQLVGVTSTMIDWTRHPDRDKCSAQVLDVAVVDEKEWIEQSLGGKCTCAGCSGF
jgi:hypothetical protein